VYEQRHKEIEKLTVRVELNVSLLGDLDGSVTLGARGSAFYLGDDLTLGIGLAGNELGVVVTLRVDNLEEAGVGGLVGLLDGGNVSNLLDFGVCHWHLWLSVYICVGCVGWCCFRCGEVDRLLVVCWRGIG